MLMWNMRKVSTLEAANSNKLWWSKNKNNKEFKRLTLPDQI